MNQGTKLFSYLLLSTAISNEAIARPADGCRYIRTLTDRKVAGQLQYGAWTAKDTQNYGGSYTQLANSGDAIITDLRNQLDSMIRSEMSGVSGYDGSSVSVAGPLKFEIGGQTANTIVDASMGLSSLAINARLSKSKTIALFVKITVRCSVDIRFNAPVFRGEYDIIGNRINFRTSQLNISHSNDCSSSFGWIPGIGSLIDGLINRKANSMIEQKIKSLVQDRLSQSYAPGNFAGLTQSIPDGKFVYGNTDYGRAIKNGIIDLFQHNRVAIQLSQRSSGGGNYFNESNELFMLNFINQTLKFTVTENRSYDQIWSGGRYCMEP